MWRKFTLIAVTLLALFDAKPATAQEKFGPVVWTALDSERPFDIAEKQTWHVRSKTEDGRPRTFEFSAIRFHLGHYQLHLVSVMDFANSSRDRIAERQGVDRNLAALLKLGLRAVFDVVKFEGQTMAVAPAGFPVEAGKMSNFGLLKVNRQVIVRLREDGPSAIFCLDNPPKSAPNRYEFQIPAFIRVEANQARRDDLIERCSNAVQVGPRIIEDPEEAASGRVRVASTEDFARKGEPAIVKVNLGIQDKAANYTPYHRTIFAVDEPSRNHPDRFSKVNARNAYLIVTHTPVTLWDIQDMLKHKDFYANAAYAPHWAINFPGGDYVGLVHAKSRDGRQVTEIGNFDATQSAVIVITRRH